MTPIFGDTHGEIDHWKISRKNVKKVCGGELPRQILVLGDFGFVWSNDPSNPTEKYWMHWLKDLPYEIYSLLGNHENYQRISQLPIVEKLGGKVRQVASNVFFLMHGEIYQIEGHSYFCFGGASSIDKGMRKAYISWWPEEIPTTSDFYYARENLKGVENQVDYVLTHTIPEELFSQVLPNEDGSKDLDLTRKMLSCFHQTVGRKKWFFGHFHMDKKFTLDNQEFQCLYDEAVVI